MKYLKLFLTVQLSTVILYCIVYLISSFIFFKFLNPINWLLRIPEYTNSERGMLLGGLAFYYFFAYSIVISWKDSEEKTK